MGHSKSDGAKSGFDSITKIQSYISTFNFTYFTSTDIQQKKMKKRINKASMIVTLLKPAMVGKTQGCADLWLKKMFSFFVFFPLNVL